MGRPRYGWPPEREARLIALRKSGLAWDDVGRKLGINGSTASERGRMLGLAGPPSKLGPELPHHAEAIRLAVKVGTAKARIALDIGISESRVYEICRREGFLRPASIAGTWERGTNGAEALPPGHPTSWGAITVGTLLEGVPYR